MIHLLIILYSIYVVWTKHSVKCYLSNQSMDSDKIKLSHTLGYQIQYGNYSFSIIK